MSRIFGIDLGTTNSLIAAMEAGQPRVIADAVTEGRYIRANRPAATSTVVAPANA